MVLSSIFLILDSAYSEYFNIFELRTVLIGNLILVFYFFPYSQQSFLKFGFFNDFLEVSTVIKFNGAWFADTDFDKSTFLFPFLKVHKIHLISIRSVLFTFGRGAYSFPLIFYDLLFSSPSTAYLSVLIFR